MKKKNDERVNQSNFLSSMLVGGSAIGGSAYFLSKFAKQHIKPEKKTTFVTPALRFSANEAPNAFITNLTGTLEGASIAKAAWKKAVESIDPNSTQTLSFTGNIDELEGAAVGSAIQQTITANKSMYMGQVFSRFKQNVGALSKHYSLTQSMPDFERVKAMNLSKGVTLSSNKLPSNLNKPISKIKKTLGNNFAEITYHTREGWEQDGFGLYNFKFNYKGSNFDLKIPSVRNNVLVEGRTQSSKRIAPRVAIYDPKSKQITSMMARDEYYLESFQRNVLPDIVSGKYKDSREIRSAIKDLYSKEIHSLESVPNVPGDIKHQGLSRYINTRSQAVDIRVLGSDGFRVPTDQEFTEAMKVGKFTPATSGSSLAKSSRPIIDDNGKITGYNQSGARVSTLDPSQWSPTPSAVDYSREPAKAIREWAATPEASQALINSGRIKFNKAFDTLARTRDLGTNAALRTLYIDPSRQRRLMGALRIDEGESLMSNNPETMRLSQVSRIAPGVHLRDQRKDIAEIISGKKSIKAGEMLGWTTEGTPFAYKDGMKLLKFTENDTTSRGEYGTLHFEEFVTMPEHAKKFGDIKAVERLSDEGFVNREVTKRTRNNLFTADIERWASMEDLRKDRSKHNKQMLTAMWEVMSDRQTRTRKGDIFARSPLTYARMLEKQGNQNPNEFIKGLMKFGLTEGGLSPKEFGYVFGAVPAVVGKKGVRDIYGELAMTEFSFRHMREMHKGFAGGMSQTIYNAARGPGVQGSLEPRAFELLQSGQYGPLGQEISQDLMGRMIASNPSITATHEGLTRTLSSISKSTKANGEVWDLATRPYEHNTFQQFIENGGGFLRSGKGLNDIFVPGASDVPGMGRFKTSSSSAVTGQLSSLYHDVAKDLGNLYSDTDNIDIEAARKRVGKFASAIQQEQAPTGKGMGSLLRGKGIAGSFYGTGVSEAGGQYTKNPFTIGLSETYARRMFDEVMDSGIYDNTQMKAMRESFFKGQDIGGVLARHPFIGQYSLQPVNFRLLRGVEDAVVTIPSMNVNMKLGGSDEYSPINISPLVGMGGDKDADMYAAFLVRPDIEKKIRTTFTNQNNEYTRAMMQHNVRAQLLKAKAAKAGILDISIEEKMIADAKKLGTAQEWVGKISAELSPARQAVSTNMKGQMSADSMFLLEWLEQTPISGKHLDPKRVYDDEMSNLFLQIQSSVRERNPERMRFAVEDILRNSDQAAKSLLTEGISIDEGRQTIQNMTGVDIGTFLPGINIKKATENIMSSLGSVEQAGMSKVSRQLSGKARVGINELGKYLEYSSRIANSGAFSNLVSHTIANKNTLLSAGMDVIKNNKMKVGFGFLGALAIGTALSTPDETIGPAGGLQSETKADYRGNGTGRAAGMEPVGPNQQSLGAPTAPDLMRSRRSMIQPGGNSARMSVRATTSHNTNVNRIVSNIGSNNRDSNISVNIRDSSAILNLHSIANKVLG